MPQPVARISAFVVAYNRSGLIACCLRSLSFADEVIVVDKSSTDATALIAARHADRVVTVPWSPTVEETREFALTLCRHEWIVFLDDDECLSAEAGAFLRAELVAPRADIYALPLRHYILGVHDERAYYWPEYHTRCFRRGSVSFGTTVHAGTILQSDRIHRVKLEGGACIHHLSHPDVSSWIERTNRYTSRPDRARAPYVTDDLAAFAHARIDHWLSRTRYPDMGGYPAAVALLRAIYDIVDRLKDWEHARGLDGTQALRQQAATLSAEQIERSQPPQTWISRTAVKIWRYANKRRVPPPS
jgi:glycosyltransferase involved in cell wall biosynthesis